jgi:hypothetical protein
METKLQFDIVSEWSSKCLHRNSVHEIMKTADLNTAMLLVPLWKFKNYERYESVITTRTIIRKIQWKNFLLGQNLSTITKNKEVTEAIKKNSLEVNIDKLCTLFIRSSVATRIQDKIIK